MFDEHIMSRQEVCLGQLFPLNELSFCVFCFQCRTQGGPGGTCPPPPPPEEAVSALKTEKVAVGYRQGCECAFYRG